MSKQNDDERAIEDQAVFVGPANAPWWKFKAAGIVWKLTRDNPFPQVARIPGVQRAALWAFETRVMSRDFVTIEKLEDDE